MKHIQVKMITSSNLLLLENACVRMAGAKEVKDKSANFSCYRDRDPWAQIVESDLQIVEFFDHHGHFRLEA